MVIRTGDNTVMGRIAALGKTKSFPFDESINVIRVTSKVHILLELD
jgi:hypothetical protein